MLLAPSAKSLEQPATAGLTSICTTSMTDVEGAKWRSRHMIRSRRLLSYMLLVPPPPSAPTHSALPLLPCRRCPAELELVSSAKLTEICLETFQVAAFLPY